MALPSWLTRAKAAPSNAVREGGATASVESPLRAPAFLRRSSAVAPGGVPSKAASPVPSSAPGAIKLARPAFLDRAPAVDGRPDPVGLARSMAAERNLKASGAGVIVGRLMGLRVVTPTFATASLVSPDVRTVHKLVGGEVLAGLTEGQDYTLTVREKRHAKYGEQAEVLMAAPYVEANVQALAKFLVANYKGIGPKSADAFLKAVLEASGEAGLAKLRDDLVNDPLSVDFSLIGKKGEFIEDKRSVAHSLVIRSLALEVDGVSIRTLEALATKLLEGVSEEADHPAKAAMDSFREDPYRLIRSVDGYAWATAEKFGKRAGIAASDPVRLRALADIAITDQCSSYGHVFLPYSVAKASVAALDPRVPSGEAIAYAVESGFVISEVVELEGGGSEERLWPADLYLAQSQLSSLIANLTLPSKSLLSMIWGNCPEGVRSKLLPGAALRSYLQEVARSLGPQFHRGLDDSQLNALEGVLTSPCRLHVIVGGPGCGKTSIMEVLLKVLQGISVDLCAPTGMGAKVLSRRVEGLGLPPARTIHSLLCGSEAGGWEMSGGKTLESDLLVIDESSMPSVGLFRAALGAVNSEQHVICLGDDEQLPSIEPGRVLSDLVAIEGVDTHRLVATHRNAGAILEVVNEVREGRIEVRSRDDVWFSDGLDDGAIDRLLEDYIGAVAEVGAKDVALLMSRRKGDVDTPGWNTTYANARLREVCNPNGAKVSGTTFRVGDRVIIRENMKVRLHGCDEADEGVVNGDTGFVVGFETEPGKQPGDKVLKCLTLLLDDARKIEFPSDSVAKLELGYARTVHASQGSEFKRVFAVITGGQPTFVNRNMLYTALSRARERLCVWGEARVLKQVAATAMPARRSDLVERVRRLRQEQVDPERECARNGEQE